MRTPIECSSPVCDNQIGWHYEYEWGPNGCDPPENVLFDENIVDDDGNTYCSYACMKQHQLHKETE